MASVDKLFRIAQLLNNLTLSSGCMQSNHFATYIWMKVLQRAPSLARQAVLRSKNASVRLAQGRRMIRLSATVSASRRPEWQKTLSDNHSANIWKRERTCNINVLSKITFIWQNIQYILSIKSHYKRVGWVGVFPEISESARTTEEKQELCSASVTIYSSLSRQCDADFPSPITPLNLFTDLSRQTPSSLLSFKTGKNAPPFNRANIV